jgi:RNA-binding protein YhbY
MPKKELKRNRAETVSVKGTITKKQKDIIGKLIGVLGSNEQDVIGKIIVLWLYNEGFLKNKNKKE